MQVAVEVRVEPEAPADRAIRIGARRRRPAPDDPARAAGLVGGLHQAVPRKAAPRLEIAPDARIANDGEEPAPVALAQCRNQLGQQAGGKRLRTGIELDARVGPHASCYNGRRPKAIGGRADTPRPPFRPPSKRRGSASRPYAGS